MADDSGGDVQARRQVPEPTPDLASLNRLVDDGNTITGAWHYPGGGGYEAISTRVE